MLLAMTQAVAEKGYARTTVADVVSGAGASRRTFYELFEDKEDCFLEAYRGGGRVLMNDIIAVLVEVEDQDWRTRTRVAIETYAGLLSSEPDFARVFLVDVLGAGPRAVEERVRAFDLFADALGHLAQRAEVQDGLPPVPPLVMHALVGGISELVLRQIVMHGAETLDELAPVLTDLVIRVVEGASR
jgi:AcrR family transcriptional regulator